MEDTETILELDELDRLDEHFDRLLSVEDAPSLMQEREGSADDEALTAVEKDDANDAREEMETAHLEPGVQALVDAGIGGEDPRNWELAGSASGQWICDGEKIFHPETGQRYSGGEDPETAGVTEQDAIRQWNEGGDVRVVIPSAEETVEGGKIIHAFQLIRGEQREDGTWEIGYEWHQQFVADPKEEAEALPPEAYSIPREEHQYAERPEENEETGPHGTTAEMLSELAHAAETSLEHKETVDVPLFAEYPFGESAPAEPVMNTIRATEAEPTAIDPIDFLPVFEPDPVLEISERHEWSMYEAVRDAEVGDTPLIGSEPAGPIESISRDTIVTVEAPATTASEEYAPEPLGENVIETPSMNVMDTEVAAMRQPEEREIEISGTSSSLRTEIIHPNDVPTTDRSAADAREQIQGIRHEAVLDPVGQRAEESAHVIGTREDRIGKNDAASALRDTESAIRVPAEFIAPVHDAHETHEGKQRAESSEREVPGHREEVLFRALGISTAGISRESIPLRVGALRPIQGASRGNILPADRGSRRIQTQHGITLVRV